MSDARRRERWIQRYARELRRECGFPAAEALALAASDLAQHDLYSDRPRKPPQAPILKRKTR